MTRILVLGLDGATFDVLNPLIEDGILPNIKRLCENGANGILQSTMPPVTGPAWLSLATGQSPGRTGIYDFIRREPESDGYTFRFLEGKEYRNSSVWDYLGEADISVGVVDYPLLSPPYAIEGFMVCGGMGSVGHRTYPPSLEDELTDFEKPAEHLNLRDDRYEDLNAFMEDIMTNLNRRTKIMTHTLANESWEFAWGVFQESDWVQHLMWKCFDDSHPEASSISDTEQQLFRDFWIRIDEIVGSCVEIAGPDTNVIIQSDHGFGPMADRAFRLNTWLKREGYMIPKRMAGTHWRVKKNSWRLLSKVASAMSLEDWAPGLFRWGKDKATSMAIQIGAIDTGRSKVFEPGHIGSMGGLYLNRDALDSGESAEELKEELREKLLAYAVEHDLELNIYFPENLYGEKAAGSPDIIVRMPDGMIEDGGWDKEIITNQPERLSHQNGSHRRPGVLIAKGPDFQRTTFDEAFVWDLAPTILHCFDQPVPSSMDGDVIDEILATERAVQYREVSGDVLENLATDEQESIKQQLSELGYIE